MDTKKRVWGLLITGVLAGVWIHSGFFGPDGNFAISNNLSYIFAGVALLIVGINSARNITKKLK